MGCPGLILGCDWAKHPLPAGPCQDSLCLSPPHPCNAPSFKGQHGARLSYRTLHPQDAGIIEAAQGAPELDGGLWTQRAGPGSGVHTRSPRPPPAWAATWPVHLPRVWGAIWEATPGSRGEEWGVRDRTGCGIVHSFIHQGAASQNQPPGKSQRLLSPAAS